MSEARIYTELLCKPENINEYIKQINEVPKNTKFSCSPSFSKSVRNCLSSWLPRFCKSGGQPKPEKSWHVIGKWHKYFEALEQAGKRWASPQVTTLSPFYADLLKKSVQVVDENEILEYKIATIEARNDQHYQTIYLTSVNDHDVRVLYNPENNIWVIENGSAHDQFEIGRTIGGIFSDSGYFFNNTSTTVIKKRIYKFFRNSTLVPFNSWDPRFRMTPIPVSEDVPKWMDPNLRKEDVKVESEKLEGGLLSDVRHKLKWYISDWTDFFNIQCISSVLFLYFVNITPIITFGTLTECFSDQKLAIYQTFGHRF